jgi:hypothetical protein
MKADYTARVEEVGRDGRARPRPDLELRRHVAIKVLPSPIPSGCSTIQARLKLRQIAAHSVASEELARRCWRSASRQRSWPNAGWTRTLSVPLDA